MIHRFTIALVVTLLIANQLIGQNSGHVVVIKNPVIDSLVQKHVALNQLQPTIDGWRIQIFFESGNNAKILANRSRDRFLEIYPDQGAYLTFNEPYYKVRVGNFRTRMDAEGFLQNIITEFPTAYIVPDNVYFEKIN
jgi:hypothetical protein